MTIVKYVWVPHLEGTCQVKASHNLSAVAVTFDERNLVPNAGLIAPAALAQRLGIADLVRQRVRLPKGPGAANSAAKALTVLASMLAGGDSIDDTDVLRAGAACELFDDLRAPSTIGTWLRAFTRGQRPPTRRGLPRDAETGGEGRAGTGQP